MKKKLAILDIGYFQTLYRDLLIDICNKNGIIVDIIQKENIENNIETLLTNYDYVLSDIREKERCTTVIHGHTILERLNRINCFIAKLFFYIGHHKEIKYSKKYYTSLKKIIATSNKIKEDLIKNYNINPEKIIIANSGFEPPANKEFIFTPQTIETKPFKIAMSALGFVNKGGYVLLGAIRKFRKLYPNIKIEVHIIYDKYEKNIPLNLYLNIFGMRDGIVKFHKRQTNMYEFYSKCHCFICPSLLEAFGRVVTEAMYSKRPVIIGSNIGATDLIKDNINGFVFEADKNKELNLALKIKEVYDKYETLEPLINKAYDDCLKYTWENFAQKVFEGLYPKITDNNK